MVFLIKTIKKEKAKVEREPIVKEKNKLKNNSLRSTPFNIKNTTLNKKLKKGKIPIDKKIDFHGMSVFEAETLFSEIVINCYENHFRCLLFVTGKGVLKKNNENFSLFIHHSFSSSIFCYNNLLVWVMVFWKRSSRL
jgi:DNA-nicking Smr family endonuclease